MLKPEGSLCANLSAPNRRPSPEAIITQAIGSGFCKSVFNIWLVIVAAHRLPRIHRASFTDHEFDGNFTHMGDV